MLKIKRAFVPISARLESLELMKKLIVKIVRRVSIHQQQVQKTNVQPVLLDLLSSQHQPVVLRVLDLLTKHKTINRLLRVQHGAHVLREDLSQELRQHQHQLIALVMIARQENFKLRVRLQAIPVHTAKPVDLMLVRLLRVIIVRVVNFKIKAVRHQ